MNWELVTNPLLNGEWMVLLAILVVAFVSYGAWQRAPGTPYRALVMAGILTLLLNPTLREEDRQPIEDIAVILVDQSDSMKLGAREAIAEEVAADLKMQLDRQATVEVRIVETDAVATDGGTALFGALERTLADIPRERLAGILAITDGQVHDAPANLASLGIDAPFHVLIAGDKDAIDRKLVIDEAPRFGIVGESIELQFRVQEEGTTSAAIPVHVLRDGTQVATMNVKPGEEQKISLNLVHGGKSIFELKADTIPGELTDQNNTAMQVVTGIRDRLRVLLVSGEPHAGERTWRNLLKADPAVDLVHFTILRPPEKQDGTPITELSLIAFPTRELFSTKLDEFDLVIFDRYRRRGVLPIAYLGNVARYVENGGAVLAAAGPAFATPFSIYRTPLSAVLPASPTGQILEEGFRAEITDEGHRHPVTADLPGGNTNPPKWGRWFRLIEATQIDGRSVMEGPGGRPLLVLNTVGNGRVAQLLSDHAWLWTRGFDGGGPQSELLRRLAHWLMKEPDLDEERLSAEAENGQLLVERVTMNETTPPVTITWPSGRTETLNLEERAPGRFHGSVASDELGLHQVTDGALRAIAALGPANPREFKDVQATAEELRALAEETGGGIFWLSQKGTPSLRTVRPDRDANGNGWAGLRANGGYVLQAVKAVPLFNPVLALVSLLGVLLWGWRREGR
ncbi:MAG: hypothetical protein RLN89_01540 [Parvibaculum sp.]